MHTVQSFPKPTEIRLACRYASKEGARQDVWMFSDSYQGTQEELEKILPYLRERDKGMEFKLVRVTTLIEDAQP